MAEVEFDVLAIGATPSRAAGKQMHHHGREHKAMQQYQRSAARMAAVAVGAATVSAIAALAVCSDGSVRKGLFYARSTDAGRNSEPMPRSHNLRGVK